MAATVQTDATFTAGNPEVLFEGNYYFGLGDRNYDIAPDGQCFLMIKPATDETFSSGQLVVVQNWLAELAQRVPVP